MTKATSEKQLDALHAKLTEAAARLGAVPDDADPTQAVTARAAAYVSSVEAWAAAEALRVEAYAAARRDVHSGVLRAATDRAAMLARVDAVDAYTVMMVCRDHLAVADQAWSRWYAAGGGGWASSQDEDAGVGGADA